MVEKYLFLIVITIALAACGEPRRTPDGHLMDRPKMSAYGENDINTSDKNDDNTDDVLVDEKK